MYRKSFIYSISGGTTGTPKLVKHDYSQWSKVVDFTSFVLKYYGLSKKSTILIAQPGFPWTIGSVFFEAAKLCGANIVATGLLLNNPFIWDSIKAIEIDYIVTAPSILLKWEAWGFIPFKNSHIIVAGEDVNPVTEKKIRETWKPLGFKRIYGNSEFGTIGFQPEEFSNYYYLNPNYSFSLNTDEEKSKKIGNLCIRRKDEIFVTDDIVELQTLSSKKTGFKLAVKFIKRKNRTYSLTDGSKISTDFILKLKKVLAIQILQCQIKRKGSSDEIVFHYVSTSKINRKKFINAIESLNPDLSEILDESKYFRIKTQKTEIHKLFVTARGKTPLIIER